MFALAGLLAAGLSVLLGLAPAWAAMGALLVLDIGCIMMLSQARDEPRERRARPLLRSESLRPGSFQSESSRFSLH